MLARQTDGVREVVDNIRISDTAATTGIDDAGAAAADRIREGADSAADATRRAGSEVQGTVNDSNIDEKAEQKP